MNYLTGGRWLNGPKLAEWLEPRLPYTRRKAQGWPEHLARRINEWRRGAAADFYVLDRFLAPLGIHASEIPDDLWLSTSPRSLADCCRNGHSRSAGNTYERPDGRVECRECKRSRDFAVRGMG